MERNVAQPSLTQQLMLSVILDISASQAQGSVDDVVNDICERKIPTKFSVIITRRSKTLRPATLAPCLASWTRICLSQSAYHNLHQSTKLHQSQGKRTRAFWRQSGVGTRSLALFNTLSKLPSSPRLGTCRHRFCRPKVRQKTSQQPGIRTFPAKTIWHHGRPLNPAKKADGSRRPAGGKKKQMSTLAFLIVASASRALAVS